MLDVLMEKMSQEHELSSFNQNHWKFVYCVESP